MGVYEAKQTIYSYKKQIDEVFKYPIPSSSEQNGDAFSENCSTNFNHANYNQTQLFQTIQSHRNNQEMDTHGGNRYQTYNLHAQHHLDQAINNPISSNSQQEKDAIGGSNSKFFNYQNYNQAQPIPKMYTLKLAQNFNPEEQEKISY